MNKGLTLVELAIVVVIMGLFSVGFYAAQSLIRSAETRAVINELSNYRNAITAFKLEFEYLPGDLPDATSYFGGLVDRDGNGNRRVGTNSWTDWAEPSSFFDHLAASEILGGDYVSANVCSGSDVWAMSEARGNHWVARSASGIFMRVKLYLTLGQHNSSSPMDQCGIAPGLTTFESHKIDEKIDDGLPNEGSVRARNLNNSATTDSDCHDTDSQYKISIEEMSCALYFFME